MAELLEKLPAGAAKQRLGEHLDKAVARYVDEADLLSRVRRRSMLVVRLSRPLAYGFVLLAGAGMVVGELGSTSWRARLVAVGVIGLVVCAGAVFLTVGWVRTSLAGLREQPAE